MFASQAKMAAAVGVAAMLVAGNPLVGVASAEIPGGGSGDPSGPVPHNTYVNVGQTYSPYIMSVSPTTTVVNDDTVQAGLATLVANSGPSNVVGISAYGMDAYELSQRLTEIQAQPGNHIVVLYGNPAHPNGILARLHLVKPATPTAGGTTNLVQVGMAYSLTDDAPSYFIGPDTPVAFLNAIATVLVTDKTDYLDPFNSDPDAVIVSQRVDPNDPSSGTYALVVPSQKALTKLLSGIPFVGPTIATATKPLIDDMVERSYNRSLNPDDPNFNPGPNQGGVLQPLQDWTSAPGRYLNDLQQGLNNAIHPPVVTPPVPDPEPEVTPESESFVPESSEPETSARLQGDTDDGSPSEGDNGDVPRRNVVRNSTVARPGQQFADDVNRTVRQVNGDLQRTVHQAQTSLHQAGQDLQGAIRDTVNNLTKPHKPNTGNSGAAGSSGDSGDSGSGNSGSDAGSGGGDK